MSAWATTIWFITCIFAVLYFAAAANRPDASKRVTAYFNYWGTFFSAAAFFGVYTNNMLGGALIIALGVGVLLLFALPRHTRDIAFIERGSVMALPLCIFGIGCIATGIQIL
jgi:hypothetical protein